MNACKGLILAAVCVALIAAPALAVETAQEWELVNPSGAIEKSSIDPAKRITSLEGKTIVLRWNYKHNGDVVLDRLSDLLTQKYPTSKVIKIYKEDHSTVKISANPAESLRIADVVASVKPDIVIASQAD
jgi:hypothetical protein